MGQRRIVRIGVVILVGAVWLVGITSEPADAQPVASVTPASGLVDQQRVRISVSGFPVPPAENRIAVFQCAAEATDVGGCGDFTTINVPTDDGAAFTRYRVSRILQTPALGQVDCATAPERCIVVVASVGQSQVVAVPISFDPSVPPLPPVDIDAELAPASTVSPRTGTVTLMGSVTCTHPTPLRVSGFVGQEQVDIQIFGDIDTTIRCRDTRQWSIRVRPRTPGARLVPGPAFVLLTIAVDRSGPRDRVELFNLSYPLVAHRLTEAGP